MFLEDFFAGGGGRGEWNQTKFVTPTCFQTHDRLPVLEIIIVQLRQPLRYKPWCWPTETPTETFLTFKTSFY